MRWGRRCILGSNMAVSYIQVHLMAKLVLYYNPVVNQQKNYIMLPMNILSTRQY